MVEEMVQLLTSQWGFFGSLLVEHVEISAIAIAVAVVLGGIVGILISEFEKSAKPTLGVINFLYTIPSISMLGFLIPFTGVGNATAIIALIIYALLPMVRNTHTGLSTIDPSILEAAKGMGSTPMQVLFKIKIPLAMPVIMSGIRNMAIMTIALAGIASFIGAGGLGTAIYRGITTNNAAMTMVGSLLIAVLALVVDFLLGIIEKRMQVRGLKARRNNRIALGIAAAACVVAIVAALLPSPAPATINVATKPMTEQYIMGEMLDLVIEEKTDLEVELTQGVGGGTSNIQPAMESGEFDLYPEYTGTAWNAVLKETDLYSEDKFSELAQRYKDDYNFSWAGMFGFNDTYGIAMSREVAERYNISTYSDLRAHADKLTLGAEYDFFEREDGYKALCDTYDLEFKSTMDMDIGLKYQAMDQGSIDVMIIFTTDGKLTSSDAVVLEDDKGFFPSYVCGNVVRQQVLDEHPELTDVLATLNDTITDTEMARMNYEVEVEGKEPRDVAREFCKEKNLVDGEAE